jgi:hypothetical protein
MAVDKLLSEFWAWPVIGWIVGTLWGFGLVMVELALTPIGLGALLIARIVFVAGGVFLAIALLKWVNTSEGSEVQKSIEKTVLCVLVLFVVAAEIWFVHWVRGYVVRTSAETQVAKPTSRPPDAQEQTRNNAGRQYQLSFTFKDSPLLTDQAKLLIKDKLENYFEYLERIGLNPPREVAPIGVAAPDGFGGCGSWAVMSPAPIYREGSIHIAETCLNSETDVTGLYSDWVFQTLLNEGAPGTRVDGYNRFHVQRIISLYYLSSFYDDLAPDARQGINSWPVVLWDVRKQFGRDFTDRSIAVAIRSMNENLKYKPNVPFDDYLCYHLLTGFSVIDNEHRKSPGVKRLLVMRGRCADASRLTKAAEPLNSKGTYQDSNPALTEEKIEAAVKKALPQPNQPAAVITPDYGNLRARATSLVQELTWFVSYRRKVLDNRYANEVKPGENRYPVFKSWNESTSGWYRQKYEQRVLSIVSELAESHRRDQRLDEDLESIKQEERTDQLTNFRPSINLSTIQEISERLAALANSIPDNYAGK